MTRDAGDSTQTSAGRRPGRPVQIDPARREEMVLDAAAALLSERSLADVTMAAIAERAGMSKRTIYGMFDSREALLAACVSRLGKALFRPLSPADRQRPLAERLNLLLTVRKTPETRAFSLELLRALLAEARTFPALAQRGCEEGRGVLERNVAAELAEAAGAGELALAPERIGLAARMLIDMAFENPIPKLLRPDTPPPTEDQIALRREWAVEIFLRGLAAARAPSGGQGTPFAPAT